MRSVGEIEFDVRKKLDELRPYLIEDGGDVEFVRFEEETRVLELRLLGNCRGCPLSLMTLRGGIERHILNEIPEIRRVEPV
jgi:Fe-S cluster biogenesis protein NfuA